MLDSILAVQMCEAQTSGIKMVLAILHEVLVCLAHDVARELSSESGLAGAGQTTNNEQCTLDDTHFFRYGVIWRRERTYRSTRYTFFGDTRKGASAGPFIYGFIHVNLLSPILGP